ncbi:MAG: hypothetical protein WCD66_06960 [Rhodanobacteraceae bacterium]
MKSAKWIFGSVLIASCTALIFSLWTRVSAEAQADRIGAAISSSLVVEAEATQKVSARSAVSTTHAEAERSHARPASPAIHVSLPPPGTPWQKVHELLIDKANAGSKAASDRLYEDTVGCMHYIALAETIQSALATNQDVSDLTKSQIARELESNAAQRQVLDKNAESCAGVTRQQLVGALYPVLLAAAVNGNRSAAVCYASGAYGKPSSDAHANDALARWADRSLGFMREGLRRGDWKMVSLMIDYFNPDTLYVPLGGAIVKSGVWRSSGDRF